MEFQKLSLLLEGKTGIFFIGYLENREHVIGNTVSVSHGIFPYFWRKEKFFISFLGQIMPSVMVATTTIEKKS